MTKLLQKAFEKASQLPELEQNTLAKWLLEELESEQKWDALFAESEELLERMADEAIEADSRGETRDLDIESL